MEFEWKKISNDYINDIRTDNNLHRLKVFGGWVLKRSYYHRGDYFESMVFIPDPDHKWEIEK